jgi:hypothetical protein
MLRSSHLPLLLLTLLPACSEPDPSPPAVSIASPAVGQPVSGTVQVQVTASDDSGITRVGLYVRGRGSPGDGVFVGSASSEPFVVSWFTPGFPNEAEVELVAEAEDATGNRRRSDPVWVRVANGGASVPSLSYLVAYTLPRTTPSLAQASSGPALGPAARLPQPLAVRPPSPARPAQPRERAAVTAAEPDPSRSYVLEWAWQPVSAAAGYRVWRSRADVAGPYTKVFDQLATGGTQKHSRVVAEAGPGARYWGSVTAVVGGNGSAGDLSRACGWGSVRVL